jgi:hypothetical protein
MELQVKSLDKPDEMLALPNDSGEVLTVKIAGLEVSRTVLQPGWRWSNDLRPIADTVSCEYAHLGTVLAGTMQVEMDDGTQVTLHAGDVASIPPGHDAWVVGEEPVVFFDWTAEEGWGKPPA